MGSHTSYPPEPRIELPKKETHPKEEWVLVPATRKDASSDASKLPQCKVVLFGEEFQSVLYSIFCGEFRNQVLAR